MSTCAVVVYRVSPLNYLDVCVSAKGFVSIDVPSCECCQIPSEKQWDNRYKCCSECGVKIGTKTVYKNKEFTDEKLRIILNTLDRIKSIEEIKVHVDDDFHLIFEIDNTMSGKYQPLDTSDISQLQTLFPKGQAMFHVDSCLSYWDDENSLKGKLDH